MLVTVPWAARRYLTQVTRGPREKFPEGSQGNLNCQRRQGSQGSECMLKTAAPRKECSFANSRSDDADLIPIIPIGVQGSE